MNTELLVPNIKNTSICVHYIHPDKYDNVWDWHIHDEYELYMCLDGKITFYLNDKNHTLNKGDMIFINERLPHKTEASKGCSGFFIQMKPAHDISALNLMQHNNSHSLFKAGTEVNQLLSVCMLNILKEYREKALSFEDFIKADVFKIFAILYRYNIITNPENYYNTKELTKLMPVFEYISKNYNKKIVLSDVSGLLNIDKSHFCRIFKKAVNVSMIDYVNLVRITKSEELLLTTKMSIDEIAEAAGFLSTAYYCKLFKRYKTCSPAQYRKHKV